jgi:hypothetical protein
MASKNKEVLLLSGFIMLACCLSCHCLPLFDLVQNFAHMLDNPLSSSIVFGSKIPRFPKPVMCWFSTNRARTVLIDKAFIEKYQEVLAFAIVIK